VALDNEATRSRRANSIAFIGVPSVAGWLGRLGEVALAVVVLEWHAISVPKRTRSGKGSAELTCGQGEPAPVSCQIFTRVLAGRQFGIFALRIAGG
jgi:hypothetical protein